MTKHQSTFVFAAIIAAVILVWSSQVHSTAFLHSQITTAGMTWHTGKVTIKSINQVENVQSLKGKPGIEIELHNTERFHIGDLDWSLQIGDLKLARPIRRSADHHSLTYLLSLDDWNKLKDGAALYLSWGYYDAKEKGVQPFAYLNKKMLGRARQSTRTGLTNRFRPIAEKRAG
jgi:hypothetical protein